MKPVKKSNKKLFLNKVTIARLEVVQMDKIYGGEISSEQDSGCGKFCEIQRQN